MSKKYKNNSLLLVINDFSMFKKNEVVKVIDSFKNDYNVYCLESKRNINGHDGLDYIDSRLRGNFGHRWNIRESVLDCNFIEIKTNSKEV